MSNKINDQVLSAAMLMSDPILNNAKETATLCASLMQAVENVRIRGGARQSLDGTYAVMSFRSARSVVTRKGSDSLQIWASPHLEVHPDGGDATTKIQQGREKIILQVPVPGRTGLIKTPTGATVRWQKSARTKEGVFFVSNKNGKKVIGFKSPVVAVGSISRKAVSQTKLLPKSAGYLLQIKVYREEIEAPPAWFLSALGVGQEVAVKECVNLLRRYMVHLENLSTMNQEESEFAVQQALGYNTKVGGREPATQEQVEKIAAHLFAAAPPATKARLVYKMICYSILVQMDLLDHDASHVGTFQKIVIMSAQTQIEELAVRSLQDASKRYGVILNRKCAAAGKTGRNVMIPNFCAKPSIGNMAQASSAQNEDAVILEALQTITTKPGIHASLDSRQLKKESFEFLYKETPEGKACGKIYVQPTTLYRPRVFYSHVVSLCKGALNVLTSHNRHTATRSHAYIGNEVIEYTGDSLDALRALEDLKLRNPASMGYVSLCFDEVGDICVEISPSEMMTPVLRRGCEGELENLSGKPVATVLSALLGKSILRYVSCCEIQRNPFVLKNYTQPFSCRTLFAPPTRITLRFIQDQQVPGYTHRQIESPAMRLATVPLTKSLFWTACMHDQDNTEDSIIVRRSSAIRMLTHVVSRVCSIRQPQASKRNSKKRERERGEASDGELTLLVKRGQRVQKGAALVKHGDVKSLDYMSPFSGTCERITRSEERVHFKFSEVLTPEDGDKVFLELGQKFTIRLRDDEDMPWMPSGRLIDAIVAPRSILARETPQIFATGKNYFLYGNSGVTRKRVCVAQVPILRSKHDSRCNRSAAGAEVSVNNRGGVQKGRNALGDGGQSWGYMERHIPFMQGASHVLQGISTQSDGGIVAVCKGCKRIAETKLGGGYVCVSQTCGRANEKKHSGFWVIESSSNFVNMVSVFALMGIDARLDCVPKSV